MQNRFSFYFFLLLLSSVADGAGLSPIADAQRFAGVGAKPDRVPEAVVQLPKTVRPSGLRVELIYAVLVGQIAAQRGEQEMAFTHFLHGARLARLPRLAELAANAALTLNDATAMQQTADLWLDLAPQAIGAHQLAAYARLKADDVPAAMEHLRRIIALAAAEGGDGYGRAAHLVSKLELPERRLKLMETLTSEEPESAEAWFARAIVAAGADRHEEAVDAAQRASDLRPGWNLPRIFLVQLLLKRGDRKQARQVLEAFVNESPDDQRLRLFYAQLLIDEREFSHARSLFEQMLRNAPKAPDVLFALGILSLQLEDLEAARDYLIQLHATGERRGDSAYYLGQVEELADNPEAAVSWYRKVGGEHAVDAGVRVALVRAKQGEVERARELLQQLRDQWPEDAPMIYLVEGTVLIELDRPDAAMAVYDEALEAFPGDHDLLYARGLHASSLDRLDIMESDFKAILAEDPDSAETLNALGYSLADRTERFTEALSYIERALALKPDDPAILDSMGWVQFRLGNPEQALEYLRKALALMPDGEIAAHLGEVLWTLGRHDEARSIWEAAREREPDHEYLLRLIGRYNFTRSDSQP
ncbi:tetratricopeptide repeat protein [Candidatus Thiosymbion oneisti]|uniref:tetratricopeptide repeat protein n=1 Tax=Candidatus Thiosymbion oneisti TaxID=589554 RepID=UPI00105C8DDE|nr:tetratricopeptide repeat protein [Candidatus Thiosymbion oneisti]